MIIKYYYSDGTTSESFSYTKILHREDGPAEEGSDGYKAWYINGELHRTDGPAIEGYHGYSKDYYIEGRSYSKKQYDKIIKSERYLWS